MHCDKKFSSKYKKRIVKDKCTKSIKNFSNGIFEDIMKVTKLHVLLIAFLLKLYFITCV